MLKNYFRIAARILARNKLYTAINALGLALGICGCIVIWLVAGFELSFDRFHPGGDRIYRVMGPLNDQGVAIPPLPETMRKQIPGLEAVTAVYDLDESAQVRVPVTGKPAKTYEPHMPWQQEWITGIALADQYWQQIFPYHWLAGNPRVALALPFSVVLTERAVKRYFGNLAPADVLGRELIYDDSLHVHVSGVVADWKGHSDQAFTDLISFSTISASFLKEKRHLEDWGMHMGGGKYFWPACYVKLSPGTTPGRIEAQIARILAVHLQTDPKHPYREVLQPLADIHFDNAYNDNRHKADLATLYLLMGIALFILVLAGVNFVNLSTAQSLQRAKEIGVRKVLGGRRGGLVMQFLVETGALTAAAVSLAVLMVWPVMRLFQDYIPVGVRFDPLAPANIAFLVGIWFVVTLLAGFYPAKVLAGYRPVQTLKGTGSATGGENGWLRRGLIVFQFTISLVFIIVTLVTGNQIRFMLNTDYGFRTNAIVSVSGQWNDTTGKINVLEQGFSQIPGIAQMVREEDPPAGWGRTTMPVTRKGSSILTVGSTMEFADERYIPFYGMSLVAGRNMRHTGNLAELVINETAAKQFGFKDPSDAVGQLLYLQDKPYPIVGVVADFHEASFREAVQPAVIGNMPGEENMLGIRLASAGKGPENVKSTLDAMEKVFKGVYPGKDFNYLFLDESIREMYAREQQTASLVRLAMGLAIFISCMGLFGLSLFTARRRAGEIGIRKVLGATTTDIAFMLNRQFVRLVLLALVIASPVAWILAHRWLQDFAYRVPINVWVFVLAGLGAVGLALVTVSYQSVTAATANPVSNLRRE